MLDSDKFRADFLLTWNSAFLPKQKMERREKIEQVVRERERVRFEQIPKKWTRRDENEFLRVLTGYGIDLQQHTSVPMPDWSRWVL